ncbi:MAG: regulatory protein RecX [Croceibacterium sp.]
MPPHSSHRPGNRPSERRERRPRPPLDRAALDALALAYVGRFATSRAKLVAYLGRKLRERGWGASDSSPGPDLDAVAGRLAGLGYIDDAVYAVAKARALTGRGFGERRIGQALRAAGIGEQDGGEARALAHDERVAAALKMAQRRRIGPFAATLLDPVQRDKALAAMLRAGHGFALARAIIDLTPGHDIDHSHLDSLR